MNDKMKLQTLLMMTEQRAAWEPLICEDLRTELFIKGVSLSCAQAYNLRRILGWKRVGRTKTTGGMIDPNSKHQLRLKNKQLRRRIKQLEAAMMSFGLDPKHYPQLENGTDYSEVRRPRQRTTSDAHKSQAAVQCAVD